MRSFLQRLFRGSASAKSRLEPESRYIVRVTELEVRCERPDGQVERVAWDELQSITIETNSDGPFLPDVFWILTGDSEASGCVIPQGATGESVLLEHLQKLPGFDNDGVIQAMASTDDQHFPCWQRPNDVERSAL